MLAVFALISMMGSSKVDTFSAPGFAAPVSGAWYGSGEAACGMPLGGLGTGFIDLTSRMTFGDCVLENNWLKPSPAASKCGFTIRAKDTTLALTPDSALDVPLRFWGHYPMADVDFGKAFGDVGVYVRAFSPLVPHDYEVSGLPAALFRFRVSNRGPVPAPIEVELQWQAVAKTRTACRGNVEGALGWKREALAPGKTWTLTPTIVFGQTRAKLIEDCEKAKGILESGVSLDPAKEENTADAKAYALGSVSDFRISPLGGFNWETTKRQSAVYQGAPNIGQLFWQVSHGASTSGVGIRGAVGLKGDAFPARTEDGTLEISLRVLTHGNDDAVTLAYDVKNVSETPVEDLSFGISLNADIGGPDKAENQSAEYVREIGGIVFVQDAAAPCLALIGSPDGIVVDSWPNAHMCMERGEWTPAGASGAETTFGPAPDGIQMMIPGGSYAVGAISDGWSIQCTKREKDVIYATGRRTLEPSEEAEIVFGLAWHFPYWTSSDGEQLRHRYALKHEDAGQVLGAALPASSDIERRILRWQNAIYASHAPALLKDAVINGLYILPRNSWWTADGRFFQSESFTGCPITETFVCRFYGSYPLALMFPECERATMRSIAGAQAESGEIPFGFGSPTGSRSPYYHVQHPIVSSEYALVAWRNHMMWQDTAWLQEMYPSVQKALRFAMTLDKDGDGCINEDPGNEKGFPANQYYDIWPWWGTSAYTGGIWLAALRAGEEMAKLCGDTAFAQELRDWFGRAQKAYEDKLWTGSHYRLYNWPEKKRKSDTSLTNALCGQWFAYSTGLGEILPKERVLATVDNVFARNVPATAFGAVNGVKTDGSPDKTFADHSAVVTIGEVWAFCAMTAFVGRQQEAVKLFETSYENILLNQRTPWNIPWSLDPDTGAIKWGINYYSNPCVWTLLQAVDPGTISKLRKARNWR